MRLRLLSSVTLTGVITCLFSTSAPAIICTEAPDCLSLGYTLTAADCSKGYVKCPWNTGLVYCECSKDYQYTCDGANETENVDIPDLPNHTYDSAVKDYDSCGNTDKIVAVGNSSTYPAAWTDRNYAPTPETAGKWCLPAAGIGNNIRNNQTIIQNAISQIGGLTYYMAWSSTEYSSSQVFNHDLDLRKGFSAIDKNNNQMFVRPVLEF